MARLATSPPDFLLGLASVVDCPAALLLAHLLCAHTLVPACADRYTAEPACQQHREDAMKILLAVDDSQYSENAVEAIAARPWPPGTTVRVLSAVENIVVPAAELWYDARGDFESARQELKKRAQKLTARVAEQIQAKGLTVETAVREGEARSAIVDEAKEWSADLIVVGSHGRTGIKRWLLGSVAQSVVSHAPCSVEVVRKKLADDT
jgi:nucleotide-binding universal stress UspA family protein